MRRLVLLLPVSAILALFACGSENAAGPGPVLVPGDTVGPVVVWFIGPPGAITSGDTIQLRYLARDTSGVARAVLRFSGAFSGEITAQFPDAPKDLEGWFEVYVPNGLTLGSTVLATLIVTDGQGRSSGASYNIRIADTRPPGARLTLAGLHADGTIRTGEVLDIQVKGYDRGRLAYIGWEGGGLRDSARAAWTDDSHTFRLTIPPSWLERPVVTAWSRDQAGNMSTVADSNTKEAPVFDWADHPRQTIAMTNEPYPMGMLWDAKRNALYVVRDSRIEVVNMPSGTLGTPIPLPVMPQGFAFTSSGDSLVVVLPGERALGVIDLRQAVRSTTLVPLQIATDTSELLGPFTRYPTYVQVSGSHVFVALVHGLFFARVLDVNLATGTQVVRTDFAGSPDVSQYLDLFKLPDGRVLVGPREDFAGPQVRFLYAPGSDSFTETSKLRSGGFGQISSSVTGRVMIKGTVFDASLDSIAEISTRDWKNANIGPAAISADGASVYTPTFYGYQKVRVSDSAVLEQVHLDWMTPQFLLALPDGSRLIAIGQLPGSNRGEHAVMIIDIR